jgi:GNAT superfamily N-acetyltransferase
MGYEVVVMEEMSSPDRDAIIRVLHDYNLAQGYRAGVKPLGILLRDPETRETIGGLWGRTSYDWLNIEFLAIPEHLRGMALGTDLLRRAEAIARERGCIGIWLTTLAFQARGFYEKLGFEVAGEIDDSPRGSKRFFMRKRFISPAP